MQLTRHTLFSIAVALPAAACVHDPVTELATAVDELGSPRCEATKVEEFSSDADEGRLVFSPDGRHAYFHRLIDGRQTIMESHRTHGRWSTPVPAAFSGTWSDVDPFVTLDGNAIYFSSWRPHEPGGAVRPDADLWRIVRTPSGWSAPSRVPDVNTDGNELFASLTADGTLYVASDRPGSQAWDIYTARPRPGGFQPMQRLRGAVNTGIWEFNPSLSPSGRLLAFGSLDPDPAAPYSDVFLSIRINGEYSERINAGPCVNTIQEEYHPTLDLAGGRLVFVRNDPFDPAYPKGDFYQVRLPGAFWGD
ncbi:MAG: hypothetical protein ACTHU0_16880 [Kofleriaceae bacterium]